MTTTNAATIRLVTAMFLSGSIGVLVVESGQASIDVVFYRCLFGAGALALFGVLTGKLRLGVMSVGVLGWMALSGVTMTANWLLFFEAYRHASISTVTIVYHLYPFALLFASALIFKERIQARSVVWALVAFAGVVCVAGAPDGGQGMDLAGAGLTLAAMTFYSATLLIAKKLADVPPELTATVQLLVGTLLLLPLVGEIDAGLGVAAWGTLLTLGIVHTGLLYVLIYGAVQRLQTSVVAVVSFLYPVTALAFDMGIYDVRPGMLQTVGMVAVLTAILGERLGWTASRRAFRLR